MQEEKGGEAKEKGRIAEEKGLRNGH